MLCSVLRDGFQFHKGTIKTDATTAENIYAALFQFHKGTIKTDFVSQHFHQDFGFNSIKVRLKLGGVQQQVCKRTFQFHKGTIKTLPTRY